MDHIEVQYRLTCTADDVEKLAEDIALEQTVEVPASLVTDPAIRENVIGQVATIKLAPPDSDGVSGDRFDATIRYNAELAGGQLPQVLNLIYGNISIKNGIRLHDLRLPNAFLDWFKGPNFGIEGLRRILGVQDRPILSTAIKPRGSSNETFAQIAHDFALGGGDLIKDDHNLVDESFEAFKERVSACHDAMQWANDKTGRSALYFPNVLTPAPDLERHVEFVARAGIRGILIAPMLVGIDAVRYLANKYPLVFMAHPTFTGTFFHDRTHGMCPSILLGTLFRIAGCDISVYPNSGGRFGFTKEECSRIQEKLADPLGDPTHQFAPSFGAPAGGMTFDRLPDMANQYGRDCVFLIGGALLSHRSSLVDGTREFYEKLCESFDVDPAAKTVGEGAAFESACEDVVRKPAGEDLGEQLQHLVCRGFNWQGRAPIPYKASAELPFEGVDRHELIGKARERCEFDLRYFEIAPGGYSSLEKHNHTHVVICNRGEGVLAAGDQRLELKPHDIAYVPPMMAHQLRNEGSEPFGFYCIVDRRRDRPIKP